MHLMESYYIRVATLDDSHQIAILMTALGHPSTNDQVRQNWRDFTTSGSIAYVAESRNGAAGSKTGSETGSAIVGVITVNRMTVLHRPTPVGRITALYVADDFRNQGIGRELVARAETDLKKLGCGIVEITSNFKLTKAHAFYEQLGYTQTSVRLVKTI